MERGTWARSVRESGLRMRRRLGIALLCYAGLAAFVWVALEGRWRLAAWIFLGGLLVRTWIAHLRD